jgi:hypothetical protein
MPRAADIGGQSSTVWAAPSWFNAIVDNALPPEFNLEDIEFHDSEFQEFVYSRAKSLNKREMLNALYCEFYGIVNTGLLVHSSDVIDYKKAKRSVLFLDEYNRSSTSILNASMQLRQTYFSNSSYQPSRYR